MQKWIADQGPEIKDWVSIDKDILAVVLGKKKPSMKPELEDEDDSYHGVNTNVAIASTVTSMARVTMSFYKNNPLWRLLYSDTDSIIIDKELTKHLVGGELGPMNLEYKLDATIFLAHKCYYLISNPQKGRKCHVVHFNTYCTYTESHYTNAKEKFLKKPNQILAPV